MTGLGQFDRRKFIQALGLGIASVGGASVLAACSDQVGTGGGSGGSTSGSGGGSGGGSGKPGLVLASVPTLDNEYFTLWQIGGSQAAKALGINFRMQSYNSSAQTQIGQMQAASAAGVTQVMTFPFNNDAVKQIGSILSKQKIPFDTSFSATPWSVPSDPSFGGGYALLNYPREIAGQQAMSEAVFKAIGGKGNVCYVNGAPTDRTSALRKKGFDQAVAKFPGIKVLDTQYGNQNGQDTRPVVQAFLAKHSNIDAIICHNSSEALGAVSVLEQKGNTHIKVGSTDEQAAILQKLVDGPNVVAVQSIYGSWLGGYMVVRAFDVAHGVKLDPLELMMFQDAVVLDTKDAVKEYQRAANANPLGFDWKKMSRHLNPNDWDTGVALAVNEPESFFAKDLGVPKPSGFKFPDALQKSIDAGNVDKLTQMYASHAKNNPFADAVKKTTTKKSVFGISY
ncbi:sugar ABC transporter substrate-binding protein [Amnibacterium sp. CER49]|uniref:sugar ABC transporter substrate-binding protein n=1 Tax=Amnibacterium sp. CER49 TaxID=3039161 RepID=UPI00244A14D4|nr:sugar ABC transporter substrate-binding protein [Amnibacterium sp. CER49]MDH2442928.1 sugar ABC transporter substrate-binding protein [Amnibacterium sp. CER49]